MYDLMPSLKPAAYFFLLELNADLSIDAHISRVKKSKGTLQGALIRRERVPSVTTYRRVSPCRRGIATIRLSFAHETRTSHDESWVYASGGVDRIFERESEAIYR